MIYRYFVHGDNMGIELEISWDMYIYIYAIYIMYIYIYIASKFFDHEYRYGNSPYFIGESWNQTGRAASIAV